MPYLKNGVDPMHMSHSASFTHTHTTHTYVFLYPQQLIFSFFFFGYLITSLPLVHTVFLYLLGLEQLHSLLPFAI
jgi:hypothetical protein